MSESEVLSKIFELVEEKKSKEAKKPRKKREMTPKQKEKMLANLKKGRETSMKNRVARANKKKAQQAEHLLAEEKARHKGVKGLDGDYNDHVESNSNIKSDYEEEIEILDDGTQLKYPKDPEQSSEPSEPEPSEPEPSTPEPKPRPPSPPKSMSVRFMSLW